MPTEVTQFAASTECQTIAEARGNRTKLTVYNDNAAAYLCVKEGADAALDSFTVKIPPGGFWEAAPDRKSGRGGVHSDIVTGIWTAATGDPAQVTETYYPESY